MKNWKGNFIVGIGLLHTVLGCIMLYPVANTLLREGLFNTVNGEPEREAFFWFIFAGLSLIILGLWLSWSEKNQIPWPGFLPWVLLGLTSLSLFIMPISGAWLMYIPVLALLFKSNSAKVQAAS